MPISSLKTLFFGIQDRVTAKSVCKNSLVIKFCKPPWEEISYCWNVAAENIEFLLDTFFLLFGYFSWSCKQSFEA